jgi:integrase
MPVDKVNTDVVLRVLKPLWGTKRETASRLRSRIELVLQAADAHGWRAGPNPAEWQGRLAHLLPGRRRVERSHHAAMPYVDVPAFITRLHGLQETQELASLLEFIVLTAVRTSEAREARWSEIDLDVKVWTIPAHRMKSGREHRVPLSDRAIELLGGADLIPGDDTDFLFPGQVRRKPFSPGAVAQFLRGLGLEVTVHGFRSAFRDWAGDETDSARETAEAALAHAVGDACERAYRRGDALDKRRKLMDKWSQYVEPKNFASNVVSLR